MINLSYTETFTFRASLLDNNSVKVLPSTLVIEFVKLILDVYSYSELIASSSSLKRSVGFSAGSNPS